MKKIKITETYIELDGKNGSRLVMVGEDGKSYLPLCEYEDVVGDYHYAPLSIEELGIIKPKSE